MTTGIPLQVDDKVIRISPDRHGLLSTLVLLTLWAVPRIVLIQKFTRGLQLNNVQLF